MARKVLILGYGREGASVLEFLRRKEPDTHFAVADRREQLGDASPHGATGSLAGVELHLGPRYLERAAEFDVIFRSPGVPLRLPELQGAKERGVKLSSLMNLFFEHAPGTVIGVTGTKGKSTTSTLIAHLLRSTRADVRLVGNIGRPALDELGGATSDTLFVTELSSFQLEDLTFSPHIAVVLGIVPEHLDHHGTFCSYTGAKARIVAKQTTQDFVCFSPETPGATDVASCSQGTQIRYGLGAGNGYRSWVQDDHIVFSRDGTYIPVQHCRQLPLLGRGNLLNALAAVAVASLLDIPAPAMQAALSSFLPLEHRLEPVGVASGIEFYNDSLSTIPEAAAHALEALGSRVRTLIVGGHDRGLEFHPVARAIADSPLEHLILLPTTGDKIWRSLVDEFPERARELRAHCAASMEEAVRIAVEHTPKGGICLLSPASSSFGLFADYKERGDSFKEQVRLYRSSKPS